MKQRLNVEANTSVPETVIEEQAPVAPAAPVEEAPVEEAPAEEAPAEEDAGTVSVG